MKQNVSMECPVFPSRALQEAQDIFGVDFDFEEFDQYADYDEDEEEEEDEVSFKSISLSTWGDNI